MKATPPFKVHWFLIGEANVVGNVYAKLKPVRFLRTFNKAPFSADFCWPPWPLFIYNWERNHMVCSKYGEFSYEAVVRC